MRYHNRPGQPLDRPNAAGRALATGRFHALGVIIFTMAAYGNAQTIAAVVAAADERGYAVVVETAHADSVAEMRGAWTRRRRHSVDGVVVIVESPLRDGADPRLPVVVVDAGGSSSCTVVDSDQAGGARDATQHLLDLGHRTVWHVAGPPASFAARARRLAWRATLRRAGADIPPVLNGDWTSASGYAHGLRLAADPAVTAVFAGNDQMALGVLRALHEAGRPVPGSVSVVGFDDVEGADSFWPPLTTVHQHFDEVGRRTVDALLHQISGTETERAHRVGVQLVERASTGRARL